MPRQRNNYSRRIYDFPDDFPQRLVRFKEESDLPWAELKRFDSKDDKSLIARIAVMYTAVTAVNLVSSSERRQEAVERERALQRERVELSRTIHDTVAQSVYVVGLGIETSRDLARKTGDELAANSRRNWTRPTRCPGRPCGS